MKYRERERQGKRESRRQASEAQRKNERQRARARDKNKGERGPKGNNLENQTKEKWKERGGEKKEKRLKKAMVVPLIFILPGYFRFFFAVFCPKKKLPDEVVSLGGRDVFKNPAGYTDRQEIT